MYVLGYFWQHEAPSVCSDHSSKSLRRESYFLCARQKIPLIQILTAALLAHIGAHLHQRLRSICRNIPIGRCLPGTRNLRYRLRLNTTLRIITDASADWYLEPEDLRDLGQVCLSATVSNEERSLRMEIQKHARLCIAQTFPNSRTTNVWSCLAACSTF